MTEDVSNMGKAGDVINVRNGFGRNYLIPKNKAVRATSRNIKAFEHQKRLIEAKKNKEIKEAQALAGSLANISCTITRKAGEQDKLFGSVTSMDIQEALKAEGYEIDRRKIILDEPLKYLGVYSIPIKFYPDVETKVKVWVVKE